MTSHFPSTITIWLQQNKDRHADLPSVGRDGVRRSVLDHILCHAVQNEQQLDCVLSEGAQANVIPAGMVFSTYAKPWCSNTTKLYRTLLKHERNPHHLFETNDSQWKQVSDIHYLLTRPNRSAWKLIVDRVNDQAVSVDKKGMAWTPVALALKHASVMEAHDLINKGLTFQPQAEFGVREAAALFFKNWVFQTTDNLRRPFLVVFEHLCALDQSLVESARQELHGVLEQIEANPSAATTLLKSYETWTPELARARKDRLLTLTALPSEDEINAARAQRQSAAQERSRINAIHHHAEQQRLAKNFSELRNQLWVRHKGNPEKCFEEAARTGSLEMMRSFISEINPNSPDLDNLQKETPLHVLCSRQNFEGIDLLLSNGFDVNARNAAGNTPLFVLCWAVATSLAYYPSAMTKKQVEGIKRLARKSPETINTLNGSGQTLLTALAGMHKSSTSVEIIALLLPYGADPFVKNDKGDNMFVAGNGHSEDSVRQYYRTLQAVLEKRQLQQAVGQAEPLPAPPRRRM